MKSNKDVLFGICNFSATAQEAAHNYFTIRRVFWLSPRLIYLPAPPRPPPPEALGMALEMLRQQQLLGASTAVRERLTRRPYCIVF